MTVKAPTDNSTLLHNAISLHARTYIEFEAAQDVVREIEIRLDAAEHKIDLLREQVRIETELNIKV